MLAGRVTLYISPLQRTIGIPHTVCKLRISSITFTHTPFCDTEYFQSAAKVRVTHTQSTAKRMNGQNNTAFAL